MEQLDLFPPDEPSSDAKEVEKTKKASQEKAIPKKAETEYFKDQRPPKGGLEYQEGRQKLVDMGILKPRPTGSTGGSGMGGGADLEGKMNRNVKPKFKSGGKEIGRAHV